jgi:hypothetical protein
VIGTGNTQINGWRAKPSLDPAYLGALNLSTAVARLHELSHDELVDFLATASPGDVSEILGAFSEIDLAGLVAALGDISHHRAAEFLRPFRVDSAHPLAVFNDLPEAAAAIDRKAANLGWAHPDPLAAFEDGYVRRHSRGRIFWSLSRIIITTGTIDECWTKSGSDCGFPVEDQKVAPSSPYGTAGVWQKFKVGAVYSSVHGAFFIANDMCYQDEGGSGGWLGFPVSRRQRKQFGRQMFEGGAMHSNNGDKSPELKSFTVSKQALAIFSGSHLNWRPTSRESSVVSSSGTQGAVQHFEGYSTPRRRATILSPPASVQTAVYTSSKKPHPVMINPEIWDYYSKLGAEKSWLGFPLDYPTRNRFDWSQEFEAGMVSWTGAEARAIRAEPLDPDRSSEEPAGGFLRRVRLNSRNR